MPHLYTAAGLLGGTALVAFMVTAGPPRSEATQLSFSSGPAPMVAQFGGTNGNANQLAANTAGTKPDNTAVVETADLAGGQVPGQPSAATQQLEWADRLASVEPTSAIAKEVARLLDRNIDLDLTTTLDRLPDVLGAAAEIPVIIDERGVDFAGVESDKAPIIFSQQNVPLRTALRRMLRPLGLRAVIEEEGLVITADPTVLVHQGIGTSQWINIDDEAERRIASELDSETEFQFVDLALTDVVDYIAELHQLTMRIDRPSLEDIGLMVDEPITLELKGVKLRTALSCLLSDLDLTYTVVGESLVVTTVEAAEEHLATRIYWLEGTGFAVGDDNRDFQSIIDLIQTSIEPDTWEALGGPSTMAPVNSTRPALMISTTYTVHENIEQMFQTLRETQFGNDPVLQRIQVPARPKAGGGLGGGGFF